MQLRRRNNILTEDHANKSEKEALSFHFRHKHQKLAVDTSDYCHLSEYISDPDNDFNMKKSVLIEYEKRTKLQKH